MKTQIAEFHVEQATLAWLSELGYQILFGPEIAPGELAAERDSYEEVILLNRLRNVIDKINPTIPQEAKDEAIRKVLLKDSPSLVVNNHSFHRMLIDGVNVEYKAVDGRIVGDIVKLIDFNTPENNDWLAVNQFTIKEGQNHRRPDVVVFVNGLPLATIELKNPADEDATIWMAYKQLETYKHEFPSFFAYNELLVISDGLEAKLGSLTAGSEWYMPWRTIDGDDLALPTQPKLEVLIKGVFEKRRLLDYLRFFIVFEQDKEHIVKKIAGYHQYHAVNKAVEATLKAVKPTGDKRCGVIWHTQGSGKSLTMVFYAGKIILESDMKNPTIVVLTDRNDLDDQLFDTFARCKELLRQTPVQAKDRAHLKELLHTASGGVIFTTIQKFLPDKESGEIKLGSDINYPLSDRRNIIVIADEAHRSQYDFIDGFARHMRDALPNASFIGFTGTPIELADKNTRAVFGDYISIYDIQQAVEDRATVPIYYEARLAKLDLNEDERPKIDPNFEEITESEEIEKREKLKTKWAQLEAVVGTEKRLGLVAADLIDHFEKRLEAMDGKAMIVCMSRRICIDLYNAITKLKPEWHSDDDDKGVIKVVMTGSASDPSEWQKHIRNKARREAMANRFKDATDPLKIVIVRDMWLTGFDIPCLHTMYLDKPMQGHSLTQAIARVNRVFKDKPGGLVVDYLGVASELRKALAIYTESGGRGKTALDQAEAVAVMKEKYEICCDLFHGFEYLKYIKGATASERLSVLPMALEHVLSQENGKERLLKHVKELSVAFALAVPHDEAIRIRDDVAFFQAVRAALVKTSLPTPKAAEELDHAIRQIVSRAVVPEGVIDIFNAAGLNKPDISILSDEFLSEVKNLPQKNLAIELLQKLLRDEIKIRYRKNIVQARSFAEMLEKTIKKYHTRSIEAAQIIMELIELAKEMQAANRRGENLGLSDDELAFYDALASNDSAVEVLGDENLKLIAHELVEAVRNNITIDWNVKESVKAKLRTIVKRILRKHGYPPDKQEAATKLVLEQTEVICEGWVS